MTKKKRGIGVGGKRAKAARSGESVARLAAAVQREITARLGPNATFEQRQDAALQVMSEALHKRADDDLHEMVTDDDEVDVDGHRYRRLEQRSSATYRGRWGPHVVEEALYREVGVRNGPTIKPIELRAGLVEHMTPDMARMVGELSASSSSRQLEHTLRATGYASPSRSFLEKRVGAMAGEMADAVATLESSARSLEEIPANVASISCGLDRLSVRMAELVTDDDGEVQHATRAEPYERTPPPLKEHHYRKAWAASLTMYDAAGTELHTLRYGTDAAADPAKLADRVSEDVVAVIRDRPGIPVHCVQDAAPELRALPEALARAVPANTCVVELVDFKHLMDYLDAVVDACEPEGDPHNWKRWYQTELLRDDRAIDRIFTKLRRLARKLPRADKTTDARTTIAKALSYIRRRRSKMRYASHYAANLPIGSGATESTCWQMQERIKRAGQSWEHGLRGVMAIRGLVLSNRWTSAWPTYAATCRKEVRAA
jgi:hypothetical protein